MTLHDLRKRVELSRLAVLGLTDGVTTEQENGLLSVADVLREVQDGLVEIELERGR